MINSMCALDFSSIEIGFTDLPSIIAILVAIYVALRMWVFIKNELQTAPKEKIINKLINILSAVFFTALTTIAIIFIVSLVLSTVAINTIFTLQETKLIYISAMARPWTFGTFIPIALFILLIFSLIYPLIEYTIMAKPSSEGPMEVQKWLESHVINRKKEPWSYFIAIFLYLAIVIVPPTLLCGISYLADVPTQFSELVSANIFYFLVFSAYLMLAPIFFLSYYATFGNAQALYRAGRLINTKNVWTSKSNFSALVLAFFAIIAAASSIYSLINNISVFKGEYPSLSPSYRDVQNGFLESLILSGLERMGSSEQIIEYFFIITAIVPLDFIVFFLTVVGFGVLGFYNKFLKYETLNRPQMVLFAGYIFTGIAFQIFLNVLVQWPWVLPEDYHFFSIEVTAEAYQNLILYIFGPAVAIEKIFLVFLLVFNLFFNKNMKVSINHALLIDLIQRNNIKGIQKFAQTRSTENKLLLLNSIQTLLKDTDLLESPEMQKHFAKILRNLARDSDPEVFNRTISLLGQVIGHNEKIDAPLFINPILELKNLSETQQKVIEDTLAQIGFVSPKRVVEIMNIFLQNPTEQNVNILVNIGKIVAQNYPSIVYKFAMNLIEQKDANARLVGLKMISELVNTQKKFQILFDKIQNLTEGKISEEGMVYSLKILGLIGIEDGAFIPKILSALSQIQTKKIEIKKQKLNTYILLISQDPKLFQQLLPEIKTYQESADPALKEALALSIGILSIYIPKQEFFSHIMPIITTLNHQEHQNDTIMENLLQSILMIAKVRGDIFEEDQFQTLVLGFLLDANLRIKVVTMLEQMDMVPLFPSFELQFHNKIHEYTQKGGEATLDSYIDDILSLILLKANDLIAGFEATPFLQDLEKLSHFTEKYRQKILQILTNSAIHSYFIYVFNHQLFESTLSSNDAAQKALVIQMYSEISTRVAKSLLNGTNEPLYYEIDSIPSWIPNKSEFEEQANILVASLNLQEVLKKIELFENDEDVQVRLAGLEFYLMLFETRTYSHSQILPILLQQNTEDSKYLIQALSLLSQIIHENIQEYNRDKKVWKQLLKKINTLFSQKLVEESCNENLQNLLFFLAKNFSDKKQIQKIIRKGAKKGKNTHIRATCIRAITILQETNADAQNIKTMFLLLNDSDPNLVMTNLHEIGTLFQHIMKEDLKVAEKAQLIAQVKKNLYRFSSPRVFSRFPENVRYVFLEELKKFITYYEDFSDFSEVLRIACMDPNPRISNNAFSALFLAIQKDTSVLRSSILARLATQNNISLQRELLLRIRNLIGIEEFSARLPDYIVPFLSVFDSGMKSELESIQQLTLSLIAQCLDGAPQLIHNNLTNFQAILFRLSDRGRYLLFRSLLPRILDNKALFQARQSRIMVLDLLRKLSKDPFAPIPRFIGTHIKEIFQQYAGFMGAFIAIAYNLIRVPDQTTITAGIEILKTILADNPAQYKTMKAQVQKTYQRTKNTEIEAFLDVLK